MLKFPFDRRINRLFHTVMEKHEGHGGKCFGVTAEYPVTILFLLWHCLKNEADHNSHSLNANKWPGLFCSLATVSHSPELCHQYYSATAGIKLPVKAAGELHLLQKFLLFGKSFSTLTFPLKYLILSAHTCLY